MANPSLRFNVSFAKPILKCDLNALIVEKMAVLGHTLLLAQAETALGGTATGSAGRLKSRDPSPGASTDGRESEEEGGRLKTARLLPPPDSILFPYPATTPDVGRD